MLCRFPEHRLSVDYLPAAYLYAAYLWGAVYGKVLLLSNGDPPEGQRNKRPPEQQLSGGLFTLFARLFFVKRAGRGRSAGNRQIIPQHIALAPDGINTGPLQAGRLQLAA